MSCHSVTEPCCLVALLLLDKLWSFNLLIPFDFFTDPFDFWFFDQFFSESTFPQD